MLRRLATLTLVLLLASCSQGEPPPSAGKAGSHSPPAPLVEVITTGNREVTQPVNRIGTLRARRALKVVTQEEGRLLQLPHFEGDLISKGMPLFRLDDALLRAELSKVKAQVRQAEQDVSRLKRLQRSKAVSEDELSRAETALEVAAAEEVVLQTRLKNTQATAPFAGVISQRLAEPGDVVARFTQLLTLLDPTSLVTEVEISELLLPALSIGDRVDLRIDALGRTPYPGRVLRIHPTINPDSRHGIVELELTPAPAGALPGQLCRITLYPRPQSRLVVPFATLQRDSLGEFLFVVRDGKAVRQAVQSGAFFDEQVEIIDGLTAGEPIISRGFYNLSEGSAVRIAGQQEHAKP